MWNLSSFKVNTKNLLKTLMDLKILIPLNSTLISSLSLMKAPLISTIYLWSMILRTKSKTTTIPNQHLSKILLPWHRGTLPNFRKIWIKVILKVSSQDQNPPSKRTKLWVTWIKVSVPPLIIVSLIAKRREILWSHLWISPSLGSQPLQIIKLITTKSNKSLYRGNLIHNTKYRLIIKNTQYKIKKAPLNQEWASGQVVQLDSN